MSGDLAVTHDFLFVNFFFFRRIGKWVRWLAAVPGVYRFICTNWIYLSVVGYLLWPLVCIGEFL